jgi:hypothetical protein
MKIFLRPILFIFSLLIITSILNNLLEENHVKYKEIDNNNEKELIKQSKKPEICELIFDFKINDNPYTALCFSSTSDESVFSFYVKGYNGIEYIINKDWFENEKYKDGFYGNKFPEGCNDYIILKKIDFNTARDIRNIGVSVMERGEAMSEIKWSDNISFQEAKKL